MHNNSAFEIQLIISLMLGPRLSSHIITQICKTLNATDSKLSSLADVNQYLSMHFPSLPKPSVDDWSEAEKTIIKQEKNHILSFSILDLSYPKSLRLIKNPPPVVFIKGNVELFNNLQAVAVVGTRKVTSNGAKIAHRISAHMAEHDWTVVSGLAIGVDAAAHNGALSVNGKTIAVLAHGLHKASPKQNSLLADEILLKNGAWISEHPYDKEARKEYFVQRNRIQIGVSCGSIIVESDINSGTATQAEFCIEADRALFAVVPESSDNPLHLFSNGPLKLVAEKNAIPIKSRLDYPMIIDKLTSVQKRLNENKQEYLF